MLRAYVGIVNSDGLACLLPDNEQWTHALLPQRASFRAVLPEAAAAEIRGELEAGQRFRAMQVLDALASEIEPLPSADSAFQSEMPQCYGLRMNLEQRGYPQRRSTIGGRPNE